MKLAYNYLSSLSLKRLVKGVFFTLALFFSLFFSIPLPYAEESYLRGDYDDLKRIQELLKQEKYNEALSLLKGFDKDNPVPDLILLYTALAERGLGRFEESNNLITKLKKDYPNSLFIKKGEAIRARNYISIIKDSMDDQVIEEAESYLLDYTASYPDDHEVCFLFALYLKGKGEIKKAKDLFLLVYQGNSRFSEDALSELNPSDVTASILTEKAKNYIKQREYKKAEEVLRKATALNDKTKSERDILEKLAYSLFMQKRYDKAAEEYIKAGDLYNAARSLFRKGDMEAFDKMLSKLKTMKDPRTGSLILALATKKRREGNLEEALKLFEDVKRDYPLLQEDALWSTAWAFYREARYREARDILLKLNKRFPSSKYDYWLKRCIMMLDKGYLIAARSEIRDDDFYSLLDYVKELESLGCKEKVIPSEILSSQTRRSSGSSPELSRFYILVSLGFYDEAIAELIQEIRSNKKPEMALEASYYLQQSGAYRRAIRFASLFKNEFKTSKETGIEDYRRIKYPLAFWSVVESTSRKFDIDPFLLLSVMREESRFEAEARSSAGAIGLMQLMPFTAKRLAKKTDLEIRDNSDIKDIKINITVGAFYLKELIKEFGTLPMAIAGYNAGKERVKEWLNKGGYRSIDEFIEDIPYKETRHYVKRVLTTYVNYCLCYTKKPTNRKNNEDPL